MPLQSVFSDTHQLSIEKKNKQHWQLKLAKGKTIDNKDFVIKFRLAAEATQSGLLSYQDHRGGFFSLMIEPPAVPKEDSITPREMVFVLDCSGSMSGEPMSASKQFMRKALRKLRPTDTFRIIRFSDAATEFSQTPLIASNNNIRQGLRYIESLQGSGGTYMTSGIEQALKPAKPKGAIRIVTFLTDGYVGNEQTILQLIKQQLDGARLFSLGVGTAVNRYLLEEMAHIGKGFVRYLKPGEDIQAATEELSDRLQSPVLTDIEIDWGELEATQVSPQPIPDLFAGQTIRVQGRYQQAGSYQIKIKGKVNGRAATLPVFINLAEQTPKQANDLSQSKNSANGEAIALSWARSEIKQQMRNSIKVANTAAENSAYAQIKEQVTQLGLDFSLVTQWTSFIAVTEKIYNNNPAKVHKQSIPLPQVSQLSAAAYSPPNTSPTFTGHGTPEPGEVISLLLILLVFAAYIYYGKGTGNEECRG